MTKKKTIYDRCLFGHKMSRSSDIENRGCDVCGK